jgi:cysteinyl-tRNA synthetase
MQLYDTLTKEKQTLSETDTVIYACGPTVYNLIHVGNARALVVADVLRRYLDGKIKLTFIQNFTDVDDKIITRAKEENLPPLELSEKYIAEYYIDADGLNIRRPDFAPKVSENIPEIAALVKTLLEKGHAYESDDGIYFEVATFRGYGKLSNKKLDELLQDSRGVNNTEIKRTAADFAIWKYSKTDDEIGWEFEGLKRGRPGWHIECSAMSYKYSGGRTLSVHMGGSDLIFPHHENELAQTETGYGIKIADIWVHNEMVNIDGKKVSKSEMNAPTPEGARLRDMFQLRTASKRYGYEPIRLLLLTSLYSKTIGYTDSQLKDCATQIRKLHEVAELLATSTPIPNSAEQKGQDIVEKFNAALDNSLNTPVALAELYALRKAIKDADDKNAYKNAFEYMCGALGLVYGFEDEYKKISAAESAVNADIPDDILALVEQRKAARAAKDWMAADEIRNKLTELGYALQETKTETIVTKTN